MFHNIEFYELGWIGTILFKNINKIWHKNNVKSINTASVSVEEIFFVSAEKKSSKIKRKSLVWRMKEDGIEDGIGCAFLVSDSRKDGISKVRKMKKQLPSK